MARGLLITFEGVDGCGKSTQLERLATHLRSLGSDPLLLREPGGTALGERLRELVLDPGTGDIAAAAEALVYAASRAELVATTIEPALDAGRIVLVDRYVDSSLAYQGAGRGLGIDRVLEANLLATRGRLPDATVLVDVPADVARARIEAGGTTPDRLEAAGDAFFARVHDAYRDLANRFPARIHTVDGTLGVELLAERVRAVLEPAFRAAGLTLDAPRSTPPEDELGVEPRT